MTPERGNFKALADERCGKCHADRLENYRDTYHGKAMALGKPNIAPEVAACYDCHGHHDILPPSDPNSHLSTNNIVATCQQCHPGATVGLHPIPPPRQSARRQKLSGVARRFSGHDLPAGRHLCVLRRPHRGLAGPRDLPVLARFEKVPRSKRSATQTGGEWFTRFVPFERFLHFLVVTSFLLLVVTGMPLKFYYTDWAKTLFHFMGGPKPPGPCTASGRW